MSESQNRDCHLHYHPNDPFLFHGCFQRSLFPCWNIKFLFTLVYSLLCNPHKTRASYVVKIQINIFLYKILFDSQVCNIQSCKKLTLYRENFIATIIPIKILNGHCHQNEDLWFILPSWLVITHSTHSGIGKGTINSHLDLVSCATHHVVYNVVSHTMEPTNNFNTKWINW